MMADNATSSSSGWNIADRVATAVLVTVQCALFARLMLPSSDWARDPTSFGAMLVGSGAVAIGGPIIIAVTIGFACRAYYCDRVSVSIPLVGILVLIATYIFPAILVTAMRS